MLRPRTIIPIASIGTALTLALAGIPSTLPEPGLERVPDCVLPMAEPTGEPRERGNEELDRADRGEAGPFAATHKYERNIVGVVILSSRPEACGVSWRQQVRVDDELMALEEVPGVSNQVREVLCVGDLLHTGRGTGWATVVDSVDASEWTMRTRTPELEGGVRVAKLIDGEGQCVTSPVDRVTTHYVGWNAEGVFDSSYRRGTPATFKSVHLIKGWQTALAELCAGDYARVWIPAELAYGHDGKGKPKGDLVFDIELLSVEPSLDHPSSTDL